MIGSNSCLILFNHLEYDLEMMGKIDRSESYDSSFGPYCSHMAHTCMRT
jgi:hypothetical protein